MTTAYLIALVFITAVDVFSRWVDRKRTAAALDVTNARLKTIESAVTDLQDDLDELFEPEPEEPTEADAELIGDAEVVP